MSAEIWIKVIAPLSVTTLEALVKSAPKGACIRSGGSVVLDGKSHNVIEFVTVAERTAEESSAIAKEAQP